MAIAPLFLADMTTLRARLRLSGAAQGDALAIIDEKVQKARVDLIRALGGSRVSAILAIPYAENPITDDQILRATAAHVEVAMVRVQLIRALPTLFIDASAQTNEVWNDEALTRQHGSPLDKEVERLEEEIADGLAALAGSDEPASTVRAAVIEPDCTPRRPFETVFPRNSVSLLP